MLVRVPWVNIALVPDPSHSQSGITFCTLLMKMLLTTWLSVPPQQLLVSRDERRTGSCRSNRSDYFALTIGGFNEWMMVSVRMEPVYSSSLWIGQFKEKLCLICLSAF